MNDFRRKDELYQLEWTKKPKTIKIGEADVPLPKIPPEKEMLNYYLPTEKQKFIKRPLPKDIMFWNENEIQEYAEAEWHRRLNGYWILIKGIPMYIPGPADVFFNYWQMKTGGTPDFRVSALELFQFWQMCENDPRCFGFAVWKPRRIGDTENVSAIGWERTTRYRNFHMGLQHTKEEDAVKTYRRILKGNNGMPFFYRLVNKGSTDPKDGLHFEIPDERITKKKLEKDGMLDIEEGHGGSITYAASVTGAYDGDFLGFYYLDEVFKIKIHRLHPMDQIRIIRPCLSYYNDTDIIGKMVLTSTVEDTQDGSTLELADQLWKDSDMNVRDENGRTISGLYRLFRSFRQAAKPDEWGFPKVEAAIKKRENQIAFFQKHQKFDDLLSLYRKQPDSIEEALSTPAADCILHPELCETRLYQIRNNLSRHGNPVDRKGQKIRRKDVYGELVWKNGVFGGEVEWIPNNNGKWCFSQMPLHPNFKRVHQGKLYPGNTRIYRMGVDPYDSATLQGKGSDGAFTVKRLFDLDAEMELDVDENGDIQNPEDMITDQIICDYTYRHRDPYDFYEDVYKTMCFVGCQAFVEKDKPGFITWMINKGLSHWLQNKPKVLYSSRQRKGEIGSKATVELISQYVDLLQGYIPKRIWCCHHPRVINDWKFFTVEKRTKYDLAVASGFMELAAINEQWEKEKENGNTWKHEFFV